VKISVIVPAFNEERLLPATLRSVRESMQAFDEAGWASELIVCDNNSTDRTAEIAAAAGARVVFEPINQIARARNAGAAQAVGDWLLFVDADSWPGVELFRDVVRAIGDPRCIAGGATVRADVDHRAVRAVVGWWNLISRVQKWAAGSFIFCEAAAFRRIGGFSEKLFASEEIDLSRRLKRLARASGRRVVILHQHPLLTSARKLHLYTPRETLWFYLRVLLTAGRSLRTREGTFVWYDGRR
jgi:glycosyltransferase involved in cell wall biosynthesis